MPFPFKQYPYLNLTDLNLDYVLSHLKEFMQLVDSLKDWQAQHEKEYEELKKLYDDIITGNFPPAMYNTLHDWVVTNAASIIGDMIKAVHFGLTNDGYFCAFIPDNWSDIQFDTITDFDDPLYGHLVLMYD